MNSKNVPDISMHSLVKMTNDLLCKMCSFLVQYHVTLRGSGVVNSTV